MPTRQAKTVSRPFCRLLDACSSHSCKRYRAEAWPIQGTSYPHTKNRKHKQKQTKRRAPTQVLYRWRATLCGAVRQQLLLVYVSFAPHRGSLCKEIQEVPVWSEQVYDDGVVYKVVLVLVVLLGLREVYPVSFGRLRDLVLGARQVFDAAVARRNARQTTAARQARSTRGYRGDGRSMALGTKNRNGT